MRREGRPEDLGSKDRAGISHFVSRAELVARRDLRDATSELRLVLAMVALTLAIPIASAIGVRALAYFGGGTAVVNRLAVVGAFFVVFIPASFSLEAALILIGRSEYLWGFAALMIVLAIVLLRMGLAGFSREALLARDVGLRKPLQRAMVAIRWSFRGRPGIVRLLWLRRIALALAAFGFVAGMGVGFLAGKTNAIPGAVVKPALSSLLSASGGATPVQEAIGIFGHNLLAFVLAALLAILTAGLSGFALTFLPGFLLGYAAALSSWSVALGGVYPNGLVEIPAAIVVGGLVIQIGAAAIHMQPNGGWTTRTMGALADYVRSLRWLVPALALAALLEVRFG